MALCHTTIALFETFTAETRRSTVLLRMGSNYQQHVVIEKQ
jgi:hypothetical protein